MTNENMISAITFCTHYNIEPEFIYSLHHHELLNLTTIDGDWFIEEEQLPDAEKLVRLHRDLNINVEGIDAVKNLLLKMQQLHHELNGLRNRLRIYEEL